MSSSIAESQYYFAMGIPGYKKKSINNVFNVPQDSFGGAEVSELIGIHILSEMNESIHIDNHRLYSDDVLMCVHAKIMINGVIRTKLLKILKSLGFTLTIEVNMKIVQFLDVDFNLSVVTVSPYQKLNINLKYINTKSKYSANVIKHIPKIVGYRISRNSSTEKIFKQKKWCMKRPKRKQGERT